MVLYLCAPYRDRLTLYLESMVGERFEASSTVRVCYGMSGN